MADVISIDGLRKHFGRLHAVDGVDMSVTAGEIFGFLGPNGAGKSTTIRCMMGFLRPTSGTVTIFGYDMAHDANRAKQRIGYLPGNVKLYDAWTGWEHIRFFEGARGKSRVVQGLIDRLGYDPAKPFRHLSSGNKQKLGLILALMHEPDLLVMDEPTVGLDPILQNEIYEILLEMRAKGATIFISSHNLREVERLCDRVALIREGKLVTVATIADLAQKKMHNIEIQTNDKLDVGALRKIKNVERAQLVPGGVTITVNGDLNAVVQQLGNFHLEDLSVEHASLEDVFMQYYQKDKER